MTVEKQLYVGDIWEIPATTVRTRTGANVDPTGLTVHVKAPDGTESTVAPIKTGVGVYYCQIPLTLPGTWHATWIGPEGEDRGVETIKRSVREAPSL